MEQNQKLKKEMQSDSSSNVAELNEQEQQK
jgi:hypothetical protein